MLHENFEIDRDAIAERVVAECVAMIEKAVPGVLDRSDRSAIVEKIRRSDGFESCVTRYVAELEAQLKGQVH